MLGVSLCGGVAVEVDGRRLPDTLLAGRQGRLVFAYLVCERHRSVPREELAELLWGEQLPSSWPASLSAVVSKLRRLLGEAGLEGAAALASAFGSYRIHLPDDAWVDWETAAASVQSAESELRAGEAARAIAAALHAEEIARRGFLTDDCPWVDRRRERLRDVLVRAVHARAEAHLLTNERGPAVGAARDALALDPLRESAYRLLMRALAAAGERGEALRVWEQCRNLLVEELGSDPDPETEAVYLEILRDEQAPSLLPSGVVTFLLTDIVDSSGLWERQPSAMAAALERHDALVTEVARSHGGQLLKAKLEGDATVSVFSRATSGALAALALREALTAEPWPEGAAPLVRMALHTGEAFERDGDFFGPALNRAARLRSLSAGGQILVSQAHAELVRDHLPAHAALRSLGHHELRGLSRGEEVYELGPAVGDGAEIGSADPVSSAGSFVAPQVPAALSTGGPFVGRGDELDRLAAEWEHAVAGTPRIVLLGGEPGVGKTRLASERAQQVHDAGGVVLYGRCDEDLGAPYQPFGEALRTLLPCLGRDRLATMRGVDELVRLVPELTELVPDLALANGGDTDRYVLFDAVARLLASVSADLPMLIVLDDLHWANKATLLMLRHILRFGEGARIQMVATYRTTDLDPAHPLAATLADLHRDGTASRLVLGGLAPNDVTAYLDAAGYDDEELGLAVASVTAGNPFFMIEVLRHVEESGGHWDPSTLPQGVREAVGRRLARLTPDANEALLAGAVVGGRFSLDLVESVVGRDLIEAVSEACDAGIVVEETGGWFRFNHAIVRRSLLAGVASVKRVRLHQRIAEHLEQAASNRSDDGLADLAHHYFESAWAGNANKAVQYCRRAAEQAMERLAFEGAADLYDRAVQALDIDEAPEREGERAELLLARCEALLAAGDVGVATDVVTQLEESARGSARLAAWATCFTGQLAVLSHPDQLDTIVDAVAAAADQLAALGDAAGEAKAHTVRASVLVRLGRIGDCEKALDRALTAARQAGDHRRVNAVLAGAPLAVLWGPSPVPRAGGRCLDVIRLLRITTGSVAVEATSTRCQAVLEAFRGRADAARHMLDHARASLTDLGLRYGLLEVDLFAGIVELVAGDAAAAEPHLRRAYNGFRRAGAGADTAQAAALVAQACAALGREPEADELCTESERLAGHDLKAAIAWRAVRARLLAGRGEHAEARRMAEAAVALAERTDALVDHGDACLALATVLDAAGDRSGARAAAGRAAALYERKGAAALVERARSLAGPGTGASSPVDRELAPRSAIFSNETAQRMEAVGAAFARSDWTALRALLPSQTWLDDRRQLVGGAAKFTDLITVLRSFAEVGSTTMDYSVLATRGKRLALTVQTIRGGDGFEDPSLLLGRTNEDQTPDLAIYFDLEDLDAAYAELDARYVAGEAEPHADVFRTIAAGIAAYNGRDFGGSPLALDIVAVDHRLIPLVSAQDKGTFWAGLEDGVAHVPDFAMRLDAVHSLDECGAVITTTQTGTTTEGAAVEIQVHTVQLVDDGSITRIEVFPEDQLDAALARLRALGSAPSRLENAATRAHTRFATSFAARDWDALRELFTDDSVYDDRRPVVGGIYRGHGEIVAMVEGVAGIGVADFVTSVLATRGDLSCLRRTRLVGRDRRPEAFHTEVLQVYEADATEQISQWVTFDSEDLGAAYAELDARYLAGEGAPHSATLAPLFESLAAYNARDWHRYRNNLADSFSMVDHRPASLGVIAGAEEFIAALKPLVDLAPSMQVSARTIHAVGPGAAVVQVDLAGTTGEGSDIELGFHVAYATGGGKVMHWDFFPEDQLDDALARFHSLVSSTPTLENTATRTLDLWRQRFVSGEWDALGELIAEDITFDDRRPVMEHLTKGRAANLEMLRATRELGVADVEGRVVATRGDRSMLMQSRWVGRDRRPDAFHTDMVQVVELAPDGLITACVQFEPADLDAAYAELDARYLAGEGAPYAETLTPLFESIAGFNARDWGSVSKHLVDNLSMVDHRLASLEAVEGANEFIRAVQPLVDLVPSAQVRARAINAVSTSAGSTYCVMDGATAEGSAVEFAFHVTWAVRGGRIKCWEYFPDHQLDAALARFEDLRAHGPVLENAATRAHTRLAQQFVDRDWPAIAEGYAENFVSDDRRAGLQTVLHGRQSAIDMSRSIAEVGVAEIVWSTLATRGERLALLELRFVGLDRSPDAFHAVVLALFDVDEAHRVANRFTFDVDDLDTAYAELEARYVAGEAAGHAAVWTVVVEHFAALSRREFAPVTPDFELVDHRRSGASLDSDQVAAFMRETFQDTPDSRYRTTAVHALADHGAVISVSVAGTTSAGSEVQWSMLNVFIVRDGRAARIEFFSDDDFDAALARFEELRPSRAPDNLAVRAAHQINRVFNERDRAGTAAVYAEDTVYEDYRQGLGVAVRGRAAVVDAVAVTWSLGSPQAELLDILGVRGDRLGLFRVRSRGHTDESFQNELLQLLEVDSTGAVAWAGWFDAGDVTGAFAHLEARFCAGLVARHAQVWEVAVGVYAAYNRHEFASVAPGFVSVDHRRASFAPGELAADLQALFELVPDVRFRITAVHALDGHGAVIGGSAEGTSEAGFEARWANVHVIEVLDGLIVRMEMYPDDQVAAALARFEELRRRPALDNLAVRVHARVIDAFNDRDQQRAAALYASDVVHEDRRLGLGVSLSGRDAAVGQLVTTWSLGTPRGELLDILGTRGDRLGLFRVRSRGRSEDSFQNELLQLVEVSPAGAITWTAWFDATDAAAARAELEARYIAGEGGPLGRKEAR